MARGIGKMAGFETETEVLVINFTVFAAHTVQEIASIENQARFGGFARMCAEI